jgi:hypothetical protein
VIHSGVNDQVLNPTDIEKSDDVDDFKQEFSNVFREGNTRRHSCN